MTEQDWFESPNLASVLAYFRDKTSERKLRLFVCACCRRIWSVLGDERSRMAVEVAERFADGLAVEHERATAEREAFCSAAGSYSAWAKLEFVNDVDDWSDVEAHMAAARAAEA